MLVEKAKKYYSQAYDFNCAETILYAANEEYSMNLTKETLKTMSAFGGGMAIESVCGAITGALAVISILFTIERAHESERVKNLTKEFFYKFYEILETNNCAELKAKYRDEEKRCWKMIEAASIILDEIIIREKDEIGF